MKTVKGKRRPAKPYPPRTDDYVAYRREHPIKGMEPLTTKDFDGLRKEIAATYTGTPGETVRAEWPKMGTAFLPGDNRTAIARLSDALDEFVKAAIALRAALKRFGV